MITVKIKSKIIFIIIAVILSAFVVLLSGCQVVVEPSDKNTDKPTEVKTEETTEDPLEIIGDAKVETGYAAPDFRVELLSGETVKLSDYKGKVVLINFWATWSEPCVGEMPDIQKLSETYADDLVVLAVNCNDPGEKETVENFITENGYTFNIGLDSQSAQEIYSVYILPYTVIVNSDGVITATHTNTAAFSDLDKYVKNALGR